MAYNKFTINQLEDEFHLEIIEETALFAHVPPAMITNFLREILRRHTALGLRSGSEKARSEYIIAPILAEVYEQAQDRTSLFSGIEFNVDEPRGLAGYCDFLFTLAPRKINIQAPVISVVEAKKEDILKAIPQCLAELVAAQIFNASENRTLPTLYGVVTNGEVWKFLHLKDKRAVVDTDNYFLDQPEKIVGIIMSMLDGGTSRPAPITASAIS